MITMFRLFILFASSTLTVTGFHPHAAAKTSTQRWAHTEDPARAIRDAKLDLIAHKLRLRVFDVDTGVFGFESKDPFYGIENIHTTIPLTNGRLGLQLTEMAHGSSDHRGLVMVTHVDDALTSQVAVGDVLIGVFVGNGKFQESLTGLDYDETIRVLDQAKQVATSAQGDGTLKLELNRLVKRQTVQLQVVANDDQDKVVNLEALAGDNLRLFLQHHNVELYDRTLHRLDQPHISGSDCGGEGICGTCYVAVERGMEHLNAVGPQESSLLRGKPEHWRAACKTVLGADNLAKGMEVRIRLQPTMDNNKGAKLQP